MTSEHTPCTIGVIVWLCSSFACAYFFVSLQSSLIMKRSHLEAFYTWMWYQSVSLHSWSRKKRNNKQENNTQGKVVSFKKQQDRSKSNVRFVEHGPKLHWLAPVVISVQTKRKALKTEDIQFPYNAVTRLALVAQHQGESNERKS